MTGYASDRGETGGVERQEEGLDGTPEVGEAGFRRTGHFGYVETGGEDFRVGGG